MGKHKIWGASQPNPGFETRKIKATGVGASLFFCRQHCDRAICRCFVESVGKMAVVCSETLCGFFVGNCVIIDPWHVVCSGGMYVLKIFRRTVLQRFIG